MSPNQAINLLVAAARSHPDSDDESLIASLCAQACPREEAHGALLFAPLAFGRTFLDRMGIEFSSLYVLFSEEGEVLEEGELTDHPFFVAALDEAGKFEDRADLKPLAFRSSEVKAINQALNAGSKPHNLLMSPAALFVSQPSEEGLQIAQYYLSELLNSQEDD